jgi:hypothetical protein
VAQFVPECQPLIFSKVAQFGPESLAQFGPEWVAQFVPEWWLNLDRNNQPGKLKCEEDNP